MRSYHFVKVMGLTCKRVWVSFDHGYTFSGQTFGGYWEACSYPLCIRFYPAGQSMPVAVSRKIEYFMRMFGLDLDVRLFPVVLTQEQVRDYQFDVLLLKSRSVDVLVLRSALEGEL